MPAAIDEAWVGLMLSVVGLSVCVCLPVLKKRKTARAVNTKVVEDSHHRP